MVLLLEHLAQWVNRFFTNDLLAKEDFSLTDGRIVNSSEGGNLLAGTYSIRRRTETSRGIYVADFDKSEQEQINYYNYGDLKNFFNYMREKRKERVLKKNCKKENKRAKIKIQL